MSEIKDIKQIKIKSLHGDIVQGNKYVHSSNAYKDMSTKELEDELARCVYKRSEINKLYIFPIMWAVMGLGLLFIGLNFGHFSAEFLLIIIGLGIGLPVLWIASIDKANKLAMQKYRQAIDEIKFELNDRK
ncbi:hypothetical protein [Acinetobacter puyangensis]|uniref:hypothetical protein n=1 Tax=Acinetobacter puyangensis TaxID=1096779 RepID=UPI003A4D7D27